MADKKTDGRTVKLFNCELRHAGNIMHSIPLQKVTDRELLLLRKMHGDDAIINIKDAGTAQMDEQQELFMLARKYANTADPLSGKKLVEANFVTSLHGFEAWLEEAQELEQMERDERAQKHREDVAKMTQEALAKSAQAAFQAAVAAGATV